MTPLQALLVALFLAVFVPLVLLMSAVSWLRYRYGLWRLRRFHVAARREWEASRR